MLYLIIFIIFVLIIWFLTTGVFIVKQKTVAVVEIFGRFYGIKEAGLRIKFPAPIAFVAGRINLKIQEIIDKVEVKTLDNAFLSFPVSVQFRAIPEKAKEAFYELEDPVDQITSYILNLIRSKAASMEMNDLYINKDDINKEVEISLKEELSGYGYEIVRVLVDEPQPSQEVANAFNRVIAARREQEAAQAEADALKIKEIGKAQAEAESLKLKAVAYVNQRKVLAEGIGDAMAELRSGLNGVSDYQILNYFADIDYRDTLRDASKNPGTLIILPSSSSKNNYFTDIPNVAIPAIAESVSKNKKNKL